MDIYTHASIKIQTKCIFQLIRYFGYLILYIIYFVSINFLFNIIFNHACQLSDGINKDTKAIGWVYFGEPSPDLSEIISEDDSVISIKNYDFSTLAKDIDISLDDHIKQKIIMTRTAILPVQPR